MGTMTELITTGDGSHEATADEATIRVSVVGRGRDRAGAVADLRSRAVGVERAVEAAGVVVAHRRLWVAEDWKAKRRTGARATLSLSLTVPPGDVLAALLTALIEADADSVDGPSWRLRDRTAAEREAQRLAVEAARRRAEGYADAAGMRLGPLLRLADGRGGREVAPMAYTQSARSRDTAQDVAELHLEPETITVQATCTATWTLLP